MLISDSLPERPSRIVAHNNRLALDKHDNPYVVQRLFETIPKLQGTEKLFEHQASLLQRNRYILDLQCLKHAGVAKSTMSQMLSGGSPSLSPRINHLSVINAAAHTKSATDKAALKILLAQHDKRPKDLGLLLVIIQLYVAHHTPLPASTLLEGFLARLSGSEEEIRYAPGIVALSIALYRLSHRKTAIRSTYRQAATYWLAQSSNLPLALIRSAGITLLDSPHPKDAQVARRIFDFLYQQDPTNRIACAGFVACYSHPDSTTDVSEATSNLTPVPVLTAGIDAEALLAAGIPTLPAATSSTSKTSSKRKQPDAPSTLVDSPSKKIRTRRSKLPKKDFVPGRPVDPERWLPLRDRSSYRPKKNGRKGRAGAGKGPDTTQGGLVDGGSSLGASASASAPVPVPSLVVESASASKGKAKKGKGRK